MTVRQRFGDKGGVNESEQHKKAGSVKQLEMRRHKLTSRLKSLTKFFIGGFFTLYVVFPFLIHYSATIQTHLIFLSLVRWPIFLDLTNPEACGITATRNFYLTSSNNVKLGVWHVLPKSLEAEYASGKRDQTFFENSLNNGLPIILYAHGNSGTRGGPHRQVLYKVLRSLNYHVITFDYRGYADSSNVRPSEDGVVADAKFMYKWLRERVPGKSIIIWGHSLGTGVATKLVQQLCTEGDPPNGLILESPFNNLRDEVKNHPLTMIYRYMPYFDKIFLDAIESNIEFASDRRISDVTVPIQILHAEDDIIIPISLGQKLYNAAKINRPENSPPVYFSKFDRQFQYGHKYLCLAPELPALISNFVKKCQRRT